MTEATSDLAEPIAVPGTGLPFLNSGRATSTRMIAMTARMPKTMRNAKIQAAGTPTASHAMARPMEMMLRITTLNVGIP